MAGSIVLDLVIAMALIFLVFSLVTSGLRELIAKVLDTRSKELWRAVRSVLDDPLKSDFREVRERAVVLDAKAEGGGAQTYSAVVDTAEAAIRAGMLEKMRPREWRARVKAELDPVRQKFPTEDEAAITRTERRLWLRQSHGSRGVLGIFKAGRRGGDRPLIPEIPSQQTVAEIAAQVRHRSKTLADAVNEHPLVRQIDGTWAGYLSRMQRLESTDFSTAAIDILRSAGVERGLSSAFEGVLKQLDELYPDGTATDRFWPAIESGLGQVMGRFEDSTITPHHVDDAVAHIRQGIDKALEGLEGLSEEAEATLLGHFDSARTMLDGYVEDPLQLVQIGIGYLDTAAPAKEALIRLTSGVNRTVEDTRMRLDEFSSSLETWYDGRMDALSVWYGKRTRMVAFGLGLVVAIGFNVDAVHAPQELWRNDHVREVVVAAAADTPGSIGACLGGDGLSDDSADCVESAVEQLVETGLPLGWDVGSDCDGTCDSLFEKATYAIGTGGEGARGTVRKLLGWLLAAAALSVGAPFWFDILKRAKGVKKSREAS